MDASGTGCDGRDASVLEKTAIARATGRLAEINAALRREVAELKNQRLALAVDRLSLQKQLRASRAAIALHRDRTAGLAHRYRVQGQMDARF
jgi:hypothetical protein